MVERHKLKRKLRKPPSPPNRKKLTKTNVKTLPAKREQYLVWDDTRGKDAANGLAVLVSPRGIRSYRCVYYFPGSTKPHWMNLGRVGEVSLAKARKRTEEVRGMSNPRDPDTPPQDPRANDPGKSDNFRPLVEDYTRHVQVGDKGNLAAHETQAVILSRTQEWHSRPVATIRPGEIEKLLWRVRDGDDDRRPAPYMANRLHAHLKHFFDWAARSSGPLKASPMVGLKKPWSREQPREREWFRGKSADDMIRAVWDAAEKIGGEEGRYLRVLLLTGKRPWGRDGGCGLGAMRWEHISSGSAWYWDAPESKAKNKRLEPVPLASHVRTALHPAKIEGYVFDLDRDRLSRLRNTVRRLTGIDNFILHGVRHIVETKMAELKITPDGGLTTARGVSGRSVAPPHIRDRLFDHAPKRGSGKDYDHHDYADEMRSAIEVWGEYVERLTTPEGVRRAR